MRAWVVVLAVCLLVSCQQSYDTSPRLVVIKECGRVWHVPEDSVEEFRQAVRLDCFFLTPPEKQREDQGQDHRLL
jgi:hypothetical protein